MTVTVRGLDVAANVSPTRYSTVSPDDTTASVGESSPTGNPLTVVTKEASGVPCPVPSNTRVTDADANGSGTAARAVDMLPAPAIATASTTHDMDEATRRARLATVSGLRWQAVRTLQR